jgi:hypothetical protein
MEILVATRQLATHHIFCPITLQKKTMEIQGRDPYNKGGGPKRGSYGGLRRGPAAIVYVHDELFS